MSLTQHTTAHSARIHDLCSAVPPNVRRYGASNEVYFTHTRLIAWFIYTIYVRQNCLLSHDVAVKQSYFNYIIQTFAHQRLCCRSSPDAYTFDRKCVCVIFFSFVFRFDFVTGCRISGILLLLFINKFHESKTNGKQKMSMLVGASMIDSIETRRDKFKWE